MPTWEPEEPELSYSEQSLKGFMRVLMQLGIEILGGLLCPGSCTMRLASIIGLWAGDQSYGHYMISYYTYQDSEQLREAGTCRI